MKYSRSLQLVASVLMVLALNACNMAPKSGAEKNPKMTMCEYHVDIAAPVDRVWDVMLSPDGYQQWVTPFMEGSYFEGSWNQGAHMRFLDPDRNGVLSVIAENREHEFVSIKHIGWVLEGVDDTTSPEVKEWTPAFENYRFQTIPGGTRVSIEQDVLAGFEEYTDEAWPKALAALKALCEAK